MKKNCPVQNNPGGRILAERFHIQTVYGVIISRPIHGQIPHLSILQAQQHQPEFY